MLKRTRRILDHIEELEATLQDNKIDREKAENGEYGSASVTIAQMTLIDDVLVRDMIRMRKFEIPIYTIGQWLKRIFKIT